MKPIKGNLSASRRKGRSARSAGGSGSGANATSAELTPTLTDGSARMKTGPAPVSPGPVKSPGPPRSPSQTRSISEPVRRSPRSVRGPAPESKPATESKPVKPELLVPVLERQFVGLFEAVSVMPRVGGPFWKISQAEGRALADAWAPICVKYGLDLESMVGMWLNAGLTTVAVLLPRAKIARDRVRHRVEEPAPGAS